MADSDDENLNGCDVNSKKESFIKSLLTPVSHSNGSEAKPNERETSPNDKTLSSSLLNGVFNTASGMEAKRKRVPRNSATSCPELPNDKSPRGSKAEHVRTTPRYPLDLNHRKIGMGTYYLC